LTNEDDDTTPVEPITLAMVVPPDNIQESAAGCTGTYIVMDIFKCQNVNRFEIHLY